MDRVRATFPFELVIMLGDNMYGGQQPADFIKKFQKPYAERKPEHALELALR